MNPMETPRTTSAAFFAQRSVNQTVYVVPVATSSQLETELATVTKERDELKAWQSEHLRILDVSNHFFRAAVDSVGIWPANDRPGIQGVCNTLSAKIAELATLRAELSEAKRDKERLRDELETVRQVATGEEQVAEDDSGGMQVIANICNRALRAATEA